MNWMMPSIGVKAPLVQRVRQATGATIIATDMSPEAKGGQAADVFYAVPRMSDPTFENKILQILVRHEIEVIYPTRQQEFAWWHGFALRHPGYQLLLPGLPTIDICCNKKLSYDWLRNQGLPVAPYALSTDGDAAYMEKQLGPLPYFAKPIDGSGSRGAKVVPDTASLAKLEPGYIVQPVLSGDEYTINTYVDRAGKCRTVIPHRRIEVRDGEVSVGVTVDDPYLIELGRIISERLPEAWGPFCYQLYHDKSKGPIGAHSVAITDLNPRIGGGYPLVLQAGGDFIAWMAAEIKGKKLSSHVGQYKVGLKMTREIGGDISFESK